MAILKGFPPSNNISPTTRIISQSQNEEKIPDSGKMTNYWIDQYYKKKLKERIGQIFGNGKRI